MKKGLGKGLGAIFEDNDFKIETPRPEEGISELRVADIEPNRSQPRKVFDEEALTTLSSSIEKHGLIQPILVEPMENGRYRIIAGERRWRASRMAGLENIPAVVRTVTEQQNMEMALIENLQREDLNPIEEAYGYKSLMDLYHMTQEEVASSVGKSRPEVANKLRLLALPEQLMDFVSNRELSAGHARALMSLDDADLQLALANKIITEGLTVRQTETLVKNAKKPKKEPFRFSGDVAMALADMEKSASEYVGNKVVIRHTPKNKGKIEIAYHSVDELEKIIDILRGGSHE